jgi:hypothetical protein
MVSSEPAAATPTSAFPPKSSPSYFLPRSDESLPVHGQVDWHGVDHLDAPSHQLAFGGCNICSGIIVNDVSWLPGRSMVVVIGIDAQDDDLRSIGNVAGNARKPPEVVSPQTPASLHGPSEPLARNIPSSTAGHISFSGTLPRTALEPCATICADTKLAGARRAPMTTSRKTRRRLISDPPLISAEPGSVSDYQIERLVSL